MKISDFNCKEYDKYEDFASEFVRSAMEYGAAFMIVNWQDALPVCQLLNTYTIGGKSCAMKSGFVDEAYSDIEAQKSCDGNMLITLFDSAEVICEKALDDPAAYVDDVAYYVEISAEEVNLPQHAKVVAFKINKEIFEGVF